ncbi:hypothetical protein QZH41_007172 [Actinostola sp. cb2023]|nr:hypothetical protein QZH41_007172 [Actinostola sp. cb2023]
MRTPTNSFVVSLALSDILTGLVIFCQYLIGFRNAAVINVVYAEVLICGAANLTAVTMDRYVAVTMPFSYHGLMTKYSKMIIAMTWVISFIIALLPLCWLGNITASYHKVYILMVVFLCIVVPYLFILFANIRIFGIVRKCVRSEKKTLIGISKNDGDIDKTRSNSMRHVFSEAKIAKVFLVAAITFAVTWFPVLYYTVAAGLGHYQAIPSVLVQLSPFTIIIGSLANPIIYSFMKPDFKSAVKNLICQGKSFQKDFRAMYRLDKNTSQTAMTPSGAVTVVKYEATKGPECSTNNGQFKTLTKNI